MQLFKRLLLSYFPDALVKDSFNPASMFISFISAKDFFTIIDRKIIENYKINLFDISMDIFEWKLWLWVHKDMMQSKMTDTYYSYIAAANFNWYKFYTVWNTAIAMSILCSLYLYDAFDKWDDDQLFVDWLFAFYLLTFLFASRIKVFPWVDEKSDFQWFIDLYFNFYEIVISQLKHKVSKKHFQDLRTKMLTNIEVFFMMFYYERRVNKLYISSGWELFSGEFYQWLFWPQLTPIQRSFVQDAKNLTSSSKFSEIEESLLFDVAPADIYLKYLFLETDIWEVISNIVSNVYDKKLLDKKLTSLMKNEEELDFILDYVTDPDNFKKGFFKWLKQYVSHMRLQDQGWFDELDEMMSEIWDDGEWLDQMQIPASIRKESKIMEQLLNFYVSYLWWLSVSRADTFFLRFFKSGLVSDLIQYFDVQLKSDESIEYYWMAHVLYVKNQAYYQFVNKKIHEWKEKFFVPASPIKTESISATAYLMRMEDEIALTTLLQDCNPQIWKLYIKNKALLDWFQAQYASEISWLIQLPQREFVYNYYEPIFSNFQLWENVLKILQNAFTEQDVVRLKNSLYSFDVQLFREVLTMIPWKSFKKIYNDSVMLNVLSLLHETLFWFIIYYKYLQLIQESGGNKKNLDLSLLKRVYILQILNWDESLYSVWSNLIDKLLEQFWSAFSIFVEFDDNKEFFSIIKENWVEFLKKLWKKSDVEKQSAFSFEDLLWLRWVLKHITYYNKRYLIPN